MFTFAGFVAKTAQNEWGHAVLCALVSHVDDTAMLNKVVTAELKVSGTNDQSIKLALHHSRPRHCCAHYGHKPYVYVVHPVVLVPGSMMTDHIDGRTDISDECRSPPPRVA